MIDLESLEALYRWGDAYSLEFSNALIDAAPALLAEVKAARAWLKAYDIACGEFAEGQQVWNDSLAACEAYRKIVEANGGF